MEPGKLIEEIGEIVRSRKAGSGKAKAAPAAALVPEPAADQAGCLAPDRHPQMDFFIADIFDAAIKDDMASMEHPIFALKAGDMRVRRYERRGNSVEIQPGVKGCATIHDKDLWIYCVSQLVEAINRGRKDVNRTVRFVAYDFLVTTNRGTRGECYDRMGDALGRLKGTTIETNIATNGVRERRGFGLIDDWGIITRDSDGRMFAVEVTLPKWLFRSVMARHVLTLSRDYFRIRRPINRRVYELVRKHCGTQPYWRVSLCVLHEKSGTTSSMKEFKRLIKELAAANDLPDYRTVFDERIDSVNFYARGPKGVKAEAEVVADRLKLEAQRGR